MYPFTRIDNSQTGRLFLLPATPTAIKLYYLPGALFCFTHSGT